MASQRNGTGRQRRGLLLAVLGAWVAVVIVGAGTQADDSLLGVDHLDIVWLVVLALGALLGLALLILLNPFSGEWTEPERPKRGGIWVVLLLTLALVIWRPELIERFVTSDEQVAGQVSEIEDVGQSNDADSVDTVAQATDVLLLLMAVAAVGALWFMLKQRQAAVSTPDPEATAVELFEADLLATLDELTVALSDNPDPRMAVLQSYALLESVLASHGSTRAPHETPSEHLRRSLQTLRVDDAPLIRLGKLYEVARFSNQPISVEQQRHAARSLEAARRGLAGMP